MSSKEPLKRDFTRNLRRIAYQIDKLETDNSKIPIKLVKQAIKDYKNAEAKAFLVKFYEYYEKNKSKWRWFF